MKNNKQDELAEALLRWAKEDKENRSVLIIAGDKESIRKTYYGSGGNLVKVLAESMSIDKDLRGVCAIAMLMCEGNKANDDDEE